LLLFKRLRAEPLAHCLTACKWLDGRIIRANFTVNCGIQPYEILRVVNAFGTEYRHKLVFGNQSPDVLAKVADAAAAGKLLSSISRTVPLSEAIPALAELEQRGTPKGKLVIVPS
jgi:NADPH:quinone reductase-like Zn-dependent oxidoreductase